MPRDFVHSSDMHKNISPHITFNESKILPIVKPQNLSILSIANMGMIVFWEDSRWFANGIFKCYSKCTQTTGMFGMGGRKLIKLLFDYTNGFITIVKVFTFIFDDSDYFKSVLGHFLAVDSRHIYASN